MFWDDGDQMGLGKHEEVSSGEVARGDGGELRSRKSEMLTRRM